MHTYLKMKENDYAIGQWLINREGHHQFTPMFTVPNIQQAFLAVNMLNGGTRIDHKVLKMEEK